MAPTKRTPGIRKCKPSCGGQCRCALLTTTGALKGETCSGWQTSPCPWSPIAAASHERCRSETQLAHGSFFPPRRHPQAQPLEPTSRNSPNGRQKHRETSAPNTRLSGTTKRRHWPPGPVHCSMQPPVCSFMLPQQLHDSTRLGWSGVESPPKAPLAARTQRGSTTSASRRRDVRKQLTACKNCISSLAVCGRRMLANPLKRSRS